MSRMLQPAGTVVSCPLLRCFLLTVSTLRGCGHAICCLPDDALIYSVLDSVERYRAVCYESGVAPQIICLYIIVSYTPQSTISTTQQCSPASPKHCLDPSSPTPAPSNPSEATSAMRAPWKNHRTRPQPNANKPCGPRRNLATIPSWNDTFVFPPLTA